MKYICVIYETGVWQMLVHFDMPLQITFPLTPAPYLIPMVYFILKSYHTLTQHFFILPYFDVQLLI